MHGPILAFLTLLFFFRVIGQVLVASFSVRWLPSMEHWFSGVIPYPALLVIQLIMLAGMIKIFSDVWRGAGFFAVSRPRWSNPLLAFSALYAASMAGRYVLTMFLRPDLRWSGHAIPIIFHFVLAGFIYTWGKYHSRSAIFARPDRAC